MSDAVWPLSLPQDVDRPYVDTMADNVIRTPMEAGPAKTRPRSTAGVRTIGGTMLLTQAQTETFQTFFEDTVRFGALRFDFPDPRTGETAVVRFTRPPQLTHVAGPTWSLRLDLEVLPS